MAMPSEQLSVERIVGKLYESESTRIRATLVRLLGSMELAEDALHDAFRAAVEQWPEDGVPDNPRSWLISTGRFQAIDRIRRRSTYDEKLAELADTIERHDEEPPDVDDDLGDDRLRLVFICCHPELPHHAQVALTLREVCGLTTEEIANAFLVATPTLAQRIVRAKRKIRDEDIPYEVPTGDELDERLDAVLNVIYLVFNEGYMASSGPGALRPELSSEGTYLGELLHELLPEPEVKGLLALMLFHEARRPARTDPKGEIVVLEEQDRALWDRNMIARADSLLEEALRAPVVGPYALQAAIAGVHADANEASETDWEEIVALYDLLLRAHPSPVVELNRAVAVAMRDGPQAGLDLIEELLANGDLDGYHLAHSAKAELCRRLGRSDEAKRAYHKAIDVCSQERELQLLRRQLESVASSTRT